MAYTNKTCAIYWLGNKHTRIIVNIIIKSWPSAVMYSFQYFEQEKSVKTEMYFISIHDKQQTCSFLLGGPLLFGPPQ